MGGPIGEGNNDDIALIAVEASDELQLRSIFSDDSWTVGGVLRISRGSALDIVARRPQDDSGISVTTSSHGPAPVSAR